MTLASSIWRDYNTDGVPSSGAYKPLKSEIRGWGADVEAFGDRITDAEADILARLPLTGGTLSGGLTINALLTTNGQIKFPSTPNPSADPNTLDEYEEGTWTPAITINGSGSGITYTSQSGNYVKIGKLVFVRGLIELSNKGGSSGTLLVTGLPFTVVSGSEDQGLPFSYWANFSSVVGNPFLRTQASATTALIGHSGAAGHATIGNANLSNTSLFKFSGSYIASA